MMSVFHYFFLFMFYYLPQRQNPAETLLTKQQLTKKTTRMETGFSSVHIAQELSRILKLHSKINWNISPQDVTIGILGNRKYLKYKLQREQEPFGS